MLITIGYSDTKIFVKNRNYTILLVIKKTVKIYNIFNVWQTEKR